jgi:hypothetical protein
MWKWLSSPSSKDLTASAGSGSTLERNDSRGEVQEASPSPRVIAGTKVIRRTNNFGVFQLTDRISGFVYGVFLSPTLGMY